MKQIIWSNTNLKLEDFEEFLEEEGFAMESENFQWNIITQMNYEYLEDERDNLNIQLCSDIIVIADLGLWDGKYSGYKIIKSGNIKDCLNSDCDYCTWYVDGWQNLRFEGYHHDGTNHYLYRQLKEDLSEIQIENFCAKLYAGTATKADISKYTDRIGNHIAAVYGWERKAS